MVRVRLPCPWNPVASSLHNDVVGAPKSRNVIVQDPYTGVVGRGCLLSNKNKKVPTVVPSWTPLEQSVKVLEESLPPFGRLNRS